MSNYEKLENTIAHILNSELGNREQLRMIMSLVRLFVDIREVDAKSEMIKKSLELLEPINKKIEDGKPEIQSNS